MKKLSGGCACGSIRYETNGEPVVMLNCHCRDCQRASGSAYAAILVVPKSSVKLERMPDVLGLQAGSLDDPDLYHPAMDIFTASARSWDHMSSETQKLPHGLPT